MKKPAKVIPLGPPLDTSDDELDMAALVTPADIAAAKPHARARMGKRGVALLDAARAEAAGDEVNE